MAPAQGWHAKSWSVPHFSRPQWRHDPTFFGFFHANTDIFRIAQKKMRRLFMLEIFQLVYKKFVYAVTYDRVGHFFLCRSKIFAYFLASNQGIHPLLNNEFAGLRLHIFTNRSKIAKTWKETCFFFLFSSPMHMTDQTFTCLLKYI